MHSLTSTVLVQPRAAASIDCVNLLTIVFNAAQSIIDAKMLCKRVRAIRETSLWKKLLVSKQQINYFQYETQS